MKSKKCLMFLTIILAVICLFIFSSRVNAATISDDGKYSLVLVVNDYDASIDGEYAKLVRFNIAEGETTVKLSELTKGILPFNGKTEFSHWEMAENTKASEDLEIANFTGNGNFYTSTGEEVNYTNGLRLNAKFSDKELKYSGKYYVSIDAFGGAINGKAKLTLESKAEEFKTIDLTKYTPVRKGCTFKGWDLDGKFVTSVDTSAFAKNVAIDLIATYTQDTFIGDDRVLVLNANGGTINGKTSNKYDYLGGGDSGTAMSLLPYIPVREGYTFNGWNSKNDGSGKNYKYMYWRLWDKDGATEVEKDTIIRNELGAEYYQNLTLYAIWTKISEEPATPEEPAKETVKVIESTSETKGNIEFEKEVNKNYKLDIQKVEIKEELSNKDVKLVVDINVLDGNNVVKISDTKMKIKIALPEELKNYEKYEVVYISDGEIKETLPATVEDGYIVFETTHLSQYGVVAKNQENNGSQEENSGSKEENNGSQEDNNGSKEENNGSQKENNNSNEEKNNNSETGTKNPKTGDNIILSAILFATSAVALGTFVVANRKRA